MSTNVRPQQKIMFVDDEADLISALRRTLRSNKLPFDIEFFTKPQSAIERLKESYFDVIVSDMRMPGMDGSVFLREASAITPNSARFVLSGQADHDAIVRALPYTHQYVAKPCNVASLVERLWFVLKLDEFSAPDEITSQLRSITAFPVQSHILTRLKEELSSASPSMGVVGECVSSDVGLSAKLLQITNSAFFCEATSVLSPERAATRLGIETLRRILFETEVFYSIDHELIDPSLREEIDQIAANAIFESALEESLTKEELALRVSGRLRLLVPLCLAREGNIALQHSSTIRTVGASNYLFTLLGLPRILQIRSSSSNEPESIDGK